MTVHFVIQSTLDFLHTAVPVRKTSDQVRDDEVHLQAAIDWLLLSIEKAGGRASSKAYRVGQGWMPPYRETSGYIIPTLLAVAERRNRPELYDTADRIGSWLSEVQSPDGGFIERELDQSPDPIVFNTGMILHGFNALIHYRGREDLIASARRAGDFLIGCMDDSGCFVRYLSNGIPHTYNVRGAWALFALGRVTGDERYQKAALANADWALSQQTERGFFRNNGFKPGGNANTHGLAYVLRGLLEIHRMSGEERFVSAVRRTAERVVSLYGARRRVAAELGENWEYLSSHICLTGYAQLAIVLLKLFRIDGDQRYRNAAFNFLDDVAATQNVTARAKPYYGAIKGSHPIYGRYAPLQYPNWATKFFIDALLVKEEARSSDADRIPVQLSAG
jgi:uncharacterized protein YyaL (SSP411 family)